MTDKLNCELSRKERIKLEFQENSMLYKFYLWLIESKGGKLKHERKKRRSS